jgi:PAS domain S-box-containing protein
MAASLRPEATEKSRVKILLVDDQPGKLLTYEAVLKDLDEVLVKARSAQEAFDHLLRNDFAVVLIDVCMPEFDGYQLAAMIRDHPRFEKTPIIFISAVYLSDFDRLRGYESGAVDYVPVPVVPEILRAKVKVFVELHRKTLELAEMNQQLENRVVQRTIELQSSNEKLQESEARFQIASEAAEFGTYECNLRDSRIYCSPQLRLLLGGVRDETLDFASFMVLIHPGDQAMVRRHILEPEGSEKRKRIEFRVIHSDGGVHWLLDCGRAFFEDEGSDSPARVIGTILDVTERKRVEERQLLLMAELDHRVKNILANVSAIAKLSSKRVGSVDEFVKSLDSRIQAISRAHSLLRRDSWIGINLNDFVQELLAPFISRQGQNIRAKGDAISLRPKAAQSLALALHELATNAVKYGALSVPEGKVHITWKAASTNGLDGAVILTWRETGGPQVREPAATGFGLTAIKAVAAELGAELQLDFAETGVIFAFEGPFGQAPQPIALQTARANGAPSLVPDEEVDGKLRVLIVEDEAVVGLQVKNDLEAAGHKVVGFATNLAQGVQLAGSTEIDVAFLDVRLGDELSTPVAENLLKRGIPFAFGTGFEDESVLPVHLRGFPRLIKPYEAHAVARLLASLSKTSRI